jgi:branched-chain amino acid transport system permease protein
MGKSGNLGRVAAFWVLLMAAPWLLTNDYYVSVLILCSINAIIAVGLNLLLGYAGQISLGHAGFYGLAAYATAILTRTAGWPVPAGMAAGVAVAAGVAWLIAIPTLKLKGHYLAMATLGFGIILYIVFNETADLTGGPSGFTSIPRLAVLGYEFESDLACYWLIATVLAGGVLIAFNLIGSRLGRALRALHTSERAAQAAGIDVARYKRFAFVLSAGFAGVAGVLYAHYLTFIAPASFGFHFSVQLITMVVLGGMASIWGAVFGAFFLTSLPEFLRAFEDVDILVYGAIMVLCMMFLPGGIASGAAAAADRLRGLVRRAAPAAEAGPKERSDG